ncbi:hypothetical protein TcCL_Unassigned03595 [Trypanosoma cruzi]|nr:hypothetical protein TcCL_Unassigned03595 [Trypanosoma cruzi]
MFNGVQSICNRDRGILAYCSQFDGATSIANKKAAELSSLIGRSCMQQKFVNRPLESFSASASTAHTSLEPPRSLPSYSWPKAGMSGVRRTTVERRRRISSFALPVGCVGQFQISDEVSAVRRLVRDGGRWWNGWGCRRPPS